MATRSKFEVGFEGGLNLREKPSKSAKILAVLPFGKAVTVDNKAEAPDGWVAVKSGGFVMKEFLK